MSLNATHDLGTSGHLDEDPEGGGYTENAYDEEEEGFFQDGVYGEEQFQGEDEGLEQSYEGYQDEVLDLQIDEPLDDDFQVSNHVTSYLCCLHSHSICAPHHIYLMSAA